jgi:hypothetical protein
VRVRKPDATGRLAARGDLAAVVLVALQGGADPAAVPPPGGPGGKPHDAHGVRQDGAADVGVPPLDRLLPRRNVVLRGAHLGPLRGVEFALESRGALVRLRGGRPANPCAWMDRVLALGAHAAMRGRGGLRCRPLSDGFVHRGQAVLHSPVPLQPERAGEPALRTVALP